MKLVFATNNPHKLEEARRLAGDRIEILSLADIGCHDDIPETSNTIEGNSLEKAWYVYDRYGIPCFSDDTGLFVDCLNGKPGAFAARYAGEHCSPDDNIDKLLAEMGDSTNRKARFHTVVTLLGVYANPLQFNGEVEGVIATSRQGNGGFGYDPVFIPTETGISFAEMSQEDKNAISHRGRALRKLFDFIKK